MAKVKFATILIYYLPMLYIKSAIKYFIQDEGIDAAAILSFSTIFAIIPILTIAFGVFSVSIYFEQLQGYLERFLFTQLLPHNYDIAIEYIRTFLASAKGIKGISIVFLFIAAMLLFYNLDNKINALYGSKKRRHFAKGLFIYVITLLVAPLLLAFSLFITSYISKQELFVFISMGGLFTAVLPIILATTGLSLMYFFIPTHTPKALNALKAGLLCAFLLEVLKSVMLMYIQYFPLYKIIYGAFAFAFLFILWVYFSWIVILFGVSYCKSLEDNRAVVDA